MTRRLPVWLLGLSNLPLGITGAVALIVTPQVLAARRAPETQIANITTLGLAGALTFCLLAPILDVRFSRRTYAIVMTIGSAVLTFIMVMSFSMFRLLGWVIFACVLLASLNCSAVGGWFGSTLPPEDDAPLGAWMTIATVAGGGVTAVLGIPLVNHAPPIVAGLLLGGLNLVPLPIILWTEPPNHGRRRASEIFGKFIQEIRELVGRSEVQLLLLLFALPSGSFALTNTLGGLGGDYGASENLVAISAGAGMIVGGVAGGLLVPVLSRRVALIVVYLGIGVIGGLSTLSLLVLAHKPAVFTIALVDQMFWQAAAISAGNGLMLSSIGKNNPLASTQFAVLTAATSAPIMYMQWVDGHAYGARGLNGLFSVDGGADLLACAVMTALLVILGRAKKFAATSNQRSPLDNLLGEIWR